MRLTSFVLILGCVLATGCQRDERDKKGATAGDGSAGSLMSGLFSIINDRSKGCDTAASALDAYAAEHKAEIEAVAADWQAARNDPAKRDAIRRPITAGRPAVNRFNSRCPGQVDKVTSIIGKATGGEIDLKPVKVAFGRSGAGAGGGGAGGPPPPRPTPTPNATMPDADGIGPPSAADLETYTKDLKGKGKLMATIETSMGTFKCELFEKQTPMTVANFVGLARGLKPWRHPATGKVEKRPFYDGIVFHRVIPQFMLQTGDPLGQGTGGPGYKFADEFVPELRFDQPGRLAMANAGPGTNGSQFFITEVPTKHLDGHHTIFGQCDNLELVQKIARVPKTPGNDSKPLDPVTIKKVTISRGK